MNWRLVGVLTAGLVGCTGGRTTPGSPAPAARAYDVWVASESADQIARVHFGAGGAEVAERRDVGSLPVEIDGPHGVAMSPDGKYVYLSIAHGLPDGSLWKIDAETSERIAWVTLGRFPASVSVTPDGEYAFIANFNLHGDPVPSSISKVHLPTMTEVARTQTCVRPHGSRISPDGSRQYSVCVADDLVIEMDVETARVRRAFSVRPGSGGPVPVPPDSTSRPAASAGGPVCSPTWVEPSVDGTSIFVTCNAGREILQIDLAKWSIERRFSTGESPYNLAVSPDGRYLLATLRSRTAPALEVFDLTTGERAGLIPTTGTLAHGVAVSADSRYAFVTSEGVGAEPGHVDIADLGTMERVASVPVAQQAGGIAIVPNR